MPSGASENSGSNWSAEGIEETMWTVQMISLTLPRTQSKKVPNETSARNPVVHVFYQCVSVILPLTLKTSPDPNYHFFPLRYSV